MRGIISNISNKSIHKLSNLNINYAIKSQNDQTIEA